MKFRLPVKVGFNKLDAEVVVGLCSKAMEWQQKFENSATQSKTLMMSDTSDPIGRQSDNKRTSGLLYGLWW